MPTRDVLSTHDVADYCGVSPRTVLRWVDAGVLPGFQTGGGRRRVQRSDLIHFMRGRGMVLPADLAPDRRRVAIIDDDLLHVQTLRRSLQSMAPGLEIRTATDGFSAGALVFSFVPHLVFLDLVMPGMDGFEVCRRIRSEPALESTGVVVVTGHVTAPVEARLLELGADLVVAKPFRRVALEPILERFVPQGLAKRPSLQV